MEKEGYFKIKLTLAFMFVALCMIFFFAFILGAAPLSITGEVTSPISGKNCYEYNLPPNYEPGIQYNSAYFYYFPGFGYYSYYFPTTKYDNCEAGILLDYSCENQKPVVEKIYCQNGCDGNACLKSEEETEAIINHIFRGV